MSTSPAPRYIGRDVFISYSRRNRAFADRLVTALETRGREAWIDLDDIPPSAEWWGEIQRGIDGAHSFIPILTPDSLASPVCTLELHYALQNHKRIIPVMHGDTDKTQSSKMAALDPAGYLSEILGGARLSDIAHSNWRAIEKLNWIMLRDEDAFEPAVETLIAALDLDLERVRLHTRLLTRAHEWDVRGQDAGYLLVEGELREAASWLTVYGDKAPKATDEQRAFIQASIEKEAADAAARQRQIRQLRTAIFGAVFAALLALLAGGFGVLQTNMAQEQQRLAGTANRQLATATQALATATSVARQAATGEAALVTVNTQVAIAVATVTQSAVLEDIVSQFADALLRDEGNPAAQIARLDALVARYPDQARVYQLRGLVHYTLSDYERAVADYDEAIRIDPNYANAYYSRGLAHASLGDFERAIADYDSALLINPEFAEVYTSRGIGYFTLGDFERAIADYDEAVRLNPRYANTYHARGVAYALSGDYQRAIADYDQAIQLNPQLSQAYFNRGTAYLQLSSSEANSEEKHDYLAQAVADIRQSETLGLLLPAEIADSVLEAEAALAAQEATAEAIP